MDERITAFPFSHFNNPMYDGSALVFLAEAIFERSPTGVFLAGVVFIAYHIGLIFHFFFFSNSDMPVEIESNGKIQVETIRMIQPKKEVNTSRTENTNSILQTSTTNFKKFKKQKICSIWGV